MTGRAAPLYSVAMAPLDAVFVSWSNADGIGALRLSTGELLRVGMSACGFVPQVGLQVQVLEAAPHPLGGRKATRVGLPAGTDADALLDAAHPLPGLQGGAAALNRFIEETDGVGLLGVVLRAPLSGRVALRRWLGRSPPLQRPRAGAVLH